MTHQIVVCGAGIVGLSTALALARRGQRVAVLAPRTAVPAADPNRYHPRVYAISPASQRFLAGLGVWDAMPASRLMPVEAMEIHGDADGQVNLNAWQAALPQLAWIVESGEIERVLVQAVRMFGIPWLEDRCTGYQDGAVDTESGTRIRAELFVGADGAASPLRTAAGMKHDAVSYDDTGLVVHLDAERAHQGTAIQWFRDDGVLALLPLPDTADGPQVSMVWSMRTEPAQALLALPADAQAARLESLLAEASEGRLGRLKVRSKLHGFPLTLERAQMVAPGIALAGDAAHRHPIAAQVGHCGEAQVGDDVRRQVARRIVYFVQQLFLDRARVDHAAGTVRLADHELAVGVDLGDGKARGMHVRHVLEPRHAEVTASDLQAAFQHVAGHGGTAQAWPIVHGPAKVGQRRAQRQGGIRYAARHHDLRACRQCFCDLGGAEVGGGADHVQAVQCAAQALAQQCPLRVARERVAVHHRNAGRGQALLAGECGNAPGRGGGIRRAKVADDVDAVAQAVAQHGADQLVQQGLVAALRVRVARQLGQGQGAFGQRFVDQHAAASGDQGAHHGGGAVAAVAGKSGGAAYVEGGERHTEAVLDQGV